MHNSYMIDQPVIRGESRVTSSIVSHPAASVGSFCDHGGRLHLFPRHFMLGRRDFNCERTTPYYFHINTSKPVGALLLQKVENRTICVRPQFRGLVGHLRKQLDVRLRPPSPRIRVLLHPPQSVEHVHHVKLHHPKPRGQELVMFPRVEKMYCIHRSLRASSLSSTRGMPHPAKTSSEVTSNLSVFFPTRCTPHCPPTQARNSHV